MRIILHTEDLEPITVVEVPLRWAQWPPPRDRFNLLLPVMLPPVWALPENVINEFAMPPRCEVLVEPMAWRNTIKPLYIVRSDQEELALALRAAWLPGQQKEVNAQHALISALLRAMSSEE